MGAEVDSPYDVVGVNRNMSAENIKKRYALNIRFKIFMFWHFA